MQKSIKNFYKLSFGNIIEWYDFSLSVYFAVFISQAFFPQFDPYVRLLLSFSTFFIGFLARPIGALLMGSFSERYSPQLMIHYCVIMMGLSTFAVACLPTYHAIGVWAPLLFVLCRIIQGLSAGGQMPGLLVISVNDHARDKSYTAGVAFSVSSLGFLLASIVGLAVTGIWGTHHAFIWRIPFALSAVLFLIYWFMNKGKYTAEQIDRSGPKKHASLWKMVHQQWGGLLAIVLLTFMAASLYYLFLTYMVTYFIHQLGFSTNAAFCINSLILVFACIFYPLMGRLCDRTNIPLMFITGWIVLLLITLPIAWILQSHSLTIIFLLMFVITLLMTMIQSAVNPLVVSVFQKHWQTSISGVAYSIGNALSGSAPLLAHMMLHHYAHQGLTMLISIYLLLGGIGYIIAYRKSTAN